jgi:hypothetical protein
LGHHDLLRALDEVFVAREELDFLSNQDALVFG